MVIALAVALMFFGAACSSDTPTTGASDSTTLPGGVTTTAGGAADPNKQCSALSAYLITVFKADSALQTNGARTGLDTDLETHGKTLWFVQPNLGTSITAINDDLKAKLAAPMPSKPPGTTADSAYAEPVLKARKQLEVNRSACKAKS